MVMINCEEIFCIIFWEVYTCMQCMLIIVILQFSLQLPPNVFPFSNSCSFKKDSLLSLVVLYVFSWVYWPTGDYNLTENWRSIPKTLELSARAGASKPPFSMLECWQVGSSADLVLMPITAVTTWVPDSGSGSSLALTILFPHLPESWGKGKEKQFLFSVRTGGWTHSFTLPIPILYHWDKGQSNVSIVISEVSSMLSGWTQVSV